MLLGSDASNAKFAVDADAQEKYLDIVELLVAAGYFRARIPSLTPFDRIIGGMTWAIRNSAVDIDVDVFFEEDAKMGTRLKIAESVVRAVVAMKCPHRLDPQQITLFDFSKIYPVMQWLINKAIERQRETGDLLRRYSESQFRKANHRLPPDVQAAARRRPATAFSQHVRTRYKPERQYRRAADAPVYTSRDDEDERVASALMEFGGAALRRAPGAGGDASKRAGAKSTKAAAESARLAEEEEARIKKIQEELSQSAATRTSVSGGFVGGLVSGAADEIAAAREQVGGGGWEERVGGSKASYQQEQHRRMVEGKRKQIAAARERLDAVTGEHSTVAERYHALRSQGQSVLATQKELQEKIAALDALETPENAGTLAVLKRLVARNEAIMKGEREFRGNCKTQHAEMQERLAALDAELAGANDDEEAQRMRLIEETWAKDAAKLRALKQLLGQKNREIAAVERRIDDVPSRIELQQYQRQFIELYDQVAAKLTETKGYYISYNVQEDKKEYLTKEISILDSIFENFKTSVAVAKPSASTIAAFVASVQQVASAVAGSVAQKASRLADERAAREALERKLQELVEKEREYYRLAKEFEQACKDNENLRAEVGEKGE